MTTDDPFDTPAPGSRFPSVAQLKDRLLVIWPKRLESVPDRYHPGAMKDRLTADVAFLDGETIAVRINKEGESTPLADPVAPGDIMRDVFLSQTKLVSQTKARIGGMVMGRLILLPKIPGSTNDRAYALDDNKAKREAGDKAAQADFETAREFVRNLPVAGFDS
jgi:hypothetical protein